MTEKKRGRGRPKGAPNKPKLELISKRETLQKNADVYEILCQAELVAKDNEDNAINGLRVFGENNGAVQPVLQWAFNDNIVSQLPEGKTPYKPNDAPDSDLTETSLRFEFRKFKYFCTNEVKGLRRESMWIELMESIPPKEAELMELVKDKIWPFKNITKEIAEKAFPNANF
jgi:hypothetical protein|tara:strand:- start:1298 stop:1813 length:516 start_codon:yes stop_codon:yes gene_type:complete